MPAVLVAADLGRLLEAHELGELVVVLDERVDLELAEPPGEGDVLRGGEGWSRKNTTL